MNLSDTLIKKLESMKGHENLLWWTYQCKDDKDNDGKFYCETGRWKPFDVRSIRALIRKGYINNYVKRILSHEFNLYNAEFLLTNGDVYFTEITEKGKEAYIELLKKYKMV